VLGRKDIKKNAAKSTITWQKNLAVDKTKSTSQPTIGPHVKAKIFLSPVSKCI
jgi:hypothetical protein